MWGYLSRLCGVSLKLPRQANPTGRARRKVLGGASSGQTVPGGPGPSRLTVCVEGNIGSGKSTLLEYFSRLQEVEAVPERVDKWCDFKGSNLMGLMYKDPCRWSYVFQSYVQLTMLESHLQATAAPIKLMERSLHSARYCFVENLHHSGKMSHVEYLVYDAWYTRLCQIFDCRPNLIVYLQTDPRLVYERARDRARAEESALPLEYFQQIHDRYEEWFNEEKFSLPCPVLVVEANGDLATMYRKYGQYTRDIVANKTLLTSLVYHR